MKSINNVISTLLCRVKNKERVFWVFFPYLLCYSSAWIDGYDPFARGEGAGIFFFCVSLISLFIFLGMTFTSD